MVAPLVLGGLLLMGYLLIPKKEDTKIYNVSGKIKQKRTFQLVDDYIKSKLNEKKSKPEVIAESKKSSTYTLTNKKIGEGFKKTKNPELSNKELKQRLDKITYKIKKGSDPNNPENYKKTFIDLGNYALDFKQRYEYKKITKSGNVVLINDNGKKKIGKVGYDKGNKRFMLRAEGSRYSVEI